MRKTPITIAVELAIDLTNLPQGSYIVMIQTITGINQCQKLIKE